MEPAFHYWFIAARSESGLAVDGSQSTKLFSSGINQTLSEEYFIYQFKSRFLGNWVDPVTLGMSSLRAQFGRCHSEAFLLYYSV